MPEQIVKRPPPRKAHDAVHAADRDPSIALIGGRKWRIWIMDKSSFILVVGAFTTVYIAGGS